MDAKQFLVEFGHIVKATGGVQQLRELVYNLAISGNLCQRNPNEGEASELLEAITLEKNKRVKEKNFKRTPKFEKMEITLPNGFVLPRSWAWTNLVSIGEISPKNTADDDLECSFVPMTGVSQEHAGDLVVETRKWGKIKKGYTQLANGDVAIAKITPCFENGKSAVIEGLKNSIGAGTTELHVVRPLPGVNPKYIYIFLRSPYFRVEGELKMTGTAGQKRLSSDYFATRAFPLPPVEEQARIVEKVDELMSLCDKLEEQQQHKRQLQNQLRQIALRTLVEASNPIELKESWRRIEDNFEELISTIDDVDEVRNCISSLILRGVVTHSSSIYKKYKQEEEVSLPEHWKYENISEFCEYITSGSRGWKKYYASNGDTFIRSQDIKSNSLKYDSRAFVSLPDKVEGKRTLVKTGDILITITGGNVGKCAVVPDLDYDAYISQHVALIRLNDSIYSRYFHEWIMNYFGGQKFLSKYIYGDKPGLNLKQVGSIEVPLPPESELSEILESLEVFNSRFEKLKSILAEKEKIAGNLAVSVVSEITGLGISKKEDVLKVPRTELVAPVALGQNKPTNKDDAPLSTLLARQNGRMNANDLWQRFGGEIDAFYAQLKVEVAHGWIAEPETANMLEKDED